MPDYDYEEFTKKHEQWDKERAENLANENNTEKKPDVESSSEDDMSW